MEEYSRRDVLRMSVLAFAGLMLQLPNIANYAFAADGKGGPKNPKLMNWDAFLSKLTELAKLQGTPKWDDVKHVAAVKNLLGKLDIHTPQIEDLRKGYVNAFPGRFEGHDIYKEVDFQVCLLQFEKGEIIPLHNHPSMTGVLMPVSGSLEIANYTIQEQSGEVSGTCLLKKNSKLNVHVGDISTLTTTEGNVHAVNPLEFSELIDVFTPAYGPNSIPKIKWFALTDDEPVQGSKNLYPARFSPYLL